MEARRWSAAALLGVGLALLAPTAASAEPPATTPGQSGVQGCAANGTVIAGAARGGAFGETVRTFAPIADENAAFFGAICGGG